MTSGFMAISADLLSAHWIWRLVTCEHTWKHGALREASGEDDGVPRR